MAITSLSLKDKLKKYITETGTISFNNSAAIPTIPASTSFTSNESIVNKAYVDQKANDAAVGITVLDPAAAATTENINLSSPGFTSLDGVVLSSGNRILVKDQDNKFDNGIYVFTSSTSALTRASDANTPAELKTAFILVKDGTVNVKTGFKLSVELNADVTTYATTDDFTGVKAITASAMTSASSYVGTSNRITVTGTTIDLATVSTLPTPLPTSEGLYQFKYDECGRITSATSFTDYATKDHTHKSLTAGTGIIPSFTYDGSAAVTIAVDSNTVPVLASAPTSAGIMYYDPTATNKWDVKAFAFDALSPPTSGWLFTLYDVANSKFLYSNAIKMPSGTTSSNIEFNRDVTFNNATVFNNGLTIKAGSLTTITPTGYLVIDTSGKVGTAATISLSAATASTLGGIQIGYTESAPNYKVKLDTSGNAYVTVPSYSVSGSGLSLNGTTFSLDTTKVPVLSTAVSTNGYVYWDAATTGWKLSTPSGGTAGITITANSSSTNVIPILFNDAVTTATVSSTSKFTFTPGSNTLTINSLTLTPDISTTGSGFYSLALSQSAANNGTRLIIKPNSTTGTAYNGLLILTSNNQSTPYLHIQNKASASDFEIFAGSASTPTTATIRMSVGATNGGVYIDSSNNITLGLAASTTTINGIVKLPSVYTATATGFVKIGAGGQLSPDTTTYIPTPATPTDGYYLKYSLGSWVAAAAPSGGTAGITITNSSSTSLIPVLLNDVTSTSVSTLYNSTCLYVVPNDASGVTRYVQVGRTIDAADLRVTGILTAINVATTTTTATLGNAAATTSVYIGNGALATGTKTINIGTGGVSGSITNITLGSSVAGTTNNITLNGNLIFGGSGQQLIQSDFSTSNTTRTLFVSNVANTSFTMIGTAPPDNTAPSKFSGIICYANPPTQNNGSGTVANSSYVQLKCSNGSAQLIADNTGTVIGGVNIPTTLQIGVSSKTTAIVVDTTGKVGINAASPNTTLDVAGTFNVTGVATLGSTLNVTGAVTAGSFNSITGFAGTGTATTAARSDHTHLYAGSATANGPATKVANALTFNGGATVSTYDGSAAVTISYNSIGAAPTANPTFTGTLTAGATVLSSLTVNGNASVYAIDTPLLIVSTTLFNNPTTVNAFGAATTLNIGGTTAANQYIKIGCGANVLTGATTGKSISIGTGGLSGTTTNITLGSYVTGAISYTSVYGTLGISNIQTITTTQAATLFTETTSTITIGSLASSITIGAGATTTKTINIGTSGSGTTNITLGSAVTGATSSTTINGNLTTTGNLIFNGTGQQLIQSDFSNATHSNRTFFVSNNPNTIHYTMLTVAPPDNTSTGKISGIMCYANPPTNSTATTVNVNNSSFIQLKCENGLAQLIADNTGTPSGTVVTNPTGTNITTTLQIGVKNKATAIVVDTNGRVGINNTGPSAQLDVIGTLAVTGATTLSSTLTVTGNIAHAGNIYPNLTAALANSVATTSGFVFIPIVTGMAITTTTSTPLVAPTVPPGTAPMFLDNANNRLYIKNGTAWKSVVLS